MHSRSSVTASIQNAILKRFRRVAELADAPDLKTLFSAFATTSETYQKLPKISFKPTTGADFSPISEAKAG